MSGYKKVICILLAIVLTLSSSSSMVIVAEACPQYRHFFGGFDSLGEKIRQNEQEIIAQPEINSQLIMLYDMLYNSWGSEIVNHIFNSIRENPSLPTEQLDDSMKKQFQDNFNISEQATTVNFEQEIQKSRNTQIENVRREFRNISVRWCDGLGSDADTLKKLQDIAQKAEGRGRLIQSKNMYLAFSGEDALRLRQQLMIESYMTAKNMEAQRAKERYKETAYKVKYGKAPNLRKVESKKFSNITTHSFRNKQKAEQQETVISADVHGQSKNETNPLLRFLIKLKETLNLWTNSKLR